MTDDFFVRVNDEGTATHIWYRDGIPTTYRVMPTWWERVKRRKWRNR